MSVTVPWKASTDTPVNGVATKLEEASVQAKQIAREATSDISKSADVQLSRAGSWLHDLLKAAAGLGTAILLSGRRSAQELGDNAQSMTKDLRNLRLTTEPKKSAPDFVPGITLLAGFGAGIALMYFLDPERGRARRILLRDRLTSWSRQATETARGTANDLRSRSQGALHETSKQLKGQMMSGTTDPQSDTQTWRTAAGDGGEYANTSYSSDVDGADDGSTTDTWGEQPQSEESRIS